MNFSPFNCTFDEITIDHLETLRNVSEGWYVEYKAEVGKQAPAKSVGSFANQYGGWLFYGIASSSGDNKAQAFPGIAGADWPNVQMRIRDDCAVNLNSCPHYDLRFVNGPSSKLALPADRGIVVLRIPQSNDTPHVHSSGRIYRRLGDRSDPVPETDRAVLDLLWERRRVARKHLKKLLHRTPDLSKNEPAGSFISLFLISDPLGDRALSSDLTLQQFREVMKSEAAPTISIPFDNFFSSPEGFVARQVAENDPGALVLTFTHKLNGNSTVRIPLRTGVLDARVAQSSKYGHLSEFVSTCETRGHVGRKWIDLNALLPVLMGCLTKQDRLLENGGLNESTYYFKARIHGVLRHIPFVDTRGFIVQIARDGVPVILFDDSFAPPGYALESLIEVDPIDLKKDKQLDLMGRATLPWLAVLSAMGLFELFGPENEGSISQLLEAATRGTDVHRGTV